VLIEKLKVQADAASIGNQQSAISDSEFHLWLHLSFCLNTSK